MKKLGWVGLAVLVVFAFAVSTGAPAKTEAMASPGIAAKACDKCPK